MTDSGASVLALLPSLGVTGGIQTAGRLAWEMLSSGAESGAFNARLFCYGEGEYMRASDGSVTQVSSKPGALLAALRIKTSFTTILVWHIGLLKLLPFLRNTDARVLLTLHGIEAWRRQDWLTRRLLDRVNLFLSDSKHTWSRFVASNPAFRQRPHTTVHLGLGSPGAGLDGSPSNPPVALMIGRLSFAEDYKGHRETIAAWPRVLQQIPDAELWIVGEGDLRGELERVADKAGVGSHVRFFGEVAEATKDRLLAHCRCLALPSRGEGFGLVYLEAMRRGRPCLVSTLDAGREVVDPPNAGLAVDPDDPSDIAAALVQLLTPGARWERWSSNARNRYESLFTAEKFKERLWSALFP